MILELGSATEFIHVTAEYSNAVLVAMLPYFSDFAAKLDLPVPVPIQAEQVVQCGVFPWRSRDGGIAGGSITIKGGWAFSFQFGYVRGFNRSRTYFGLQNPDEVPSFFGEERMSRDEAVQMARDTLKKLGISLEAVFAEQEPRVTLPERIGTNTVPHYRIEWPSPRGGSSVDVEINGNARRVESLWMLNKSLERPPPKVNVIPPVNSGHIRNRSPRVNPEYAYQLIPIVLRAVDEYGAKLGLGVPRPLTTNHVARFALFDNGGWPHSELELTNGWRFIYRNQMVNGYYAPDNFFNSENRPILIKQFAGNWNMTETEAIEIARQALAKLNYPSNLVHMDFRPEVSKPFVTGKESIPRYMLRWNFASPTDDDLVSKVEAEVDANRRELKSLYYDHKVYWNHRPPIDVPLSLPPRTEANSVPEKGVPQPKKLRKPPTEPFTPLKPRQE